MLSLKLSLPARSAGQAAAPVGINAFVRIDGDGTVHLTMPYIEMGQGTYTSISMLIAEELEVDLGQVRYEHAPPNDKLYANPLVGFQVTGGSTAIRAAWQPLRESRCRRAHDAHFCGGLAVGRGRSIVPGGEGRRSSTCRRTGV